MKRCKPQARGLARRQAMLDAATELFLENGFEHTSLSDIVSRSKGSRSTLYEQFGSKEGLLRTMIEQVTGRVWEAFREGDIATASRVEDALIDLGISFFRAALAPDAIACFRIIAAEGRRIPEIAELFFERGPRTIERLLAERFQESLETRDGTGTPHEMARVFLGAVLGTIHAHHVLGLTPVYGDAEIEAQARVAVRIFLNGVGRHHPDRASREDGD